MGEFHHIKAGDALRREPASPITHACLGEIGCEECGLYERGCGRCDVGVTCVRLQESLQAMAAASTEKEVKWLLNGRG